MKRTALTHEFICETQAAVRTKNRDRGNVSRRCINGFFIPDCFIDIPNDQSLIFCTATAHSHLGENVPHDFTFRADGDI